MKHKFFIVIAILIITGLSKILSGQTDSTKNYQIRTLAELGFSGQKVLYEYFNFHLLASSGIYFKNGVAVSLCTGIEMMDIHLVPAILEGKYIFCKKSSTRPFIYAQYGYGFPVGKTNTQESLDGGNIFGVGAGVMVKKKNGKERFYSLGYRTQKIMEEIKQPWQNGIVRNEINYERLFFKIGWFFN